MIEVFTRQTNLNLLLRAKTLLTSRYGIYICLVLFIAMSLGSHSFAYWPGDNWWLRSAYWLVYLLLALSAVYGVYFLLKQFPILGSGVSKNDHLRFFFAVLLSFPVFAALISALDISTGRGTSRFFLEIHRTGLFSTISLSFISKLLLKYLTLGGLLYTLQFYFRFDNSGTTNNGIDSLNKTMGNDASSAISSETGTTKAIDFHQIPFLKKLPKNQISQPILLRAQEHYLDVVTESGGELILYKFSQAIRELPKELGVKTHRSYWVAKSNVKGWYRNGSGLKVRLNIGDDIPVSRRYEQQIKQFFSEIKP